MDTEALSEAMRGVHYVYHFAGIADIEEAQTQPYHTIETNIMGLTKYSTIYSSHEEAIKDMSS